MARHGAFTLSPRMMVMSSAILLLSSGIMQLLAAWSLLRAQGSHDENRFHTFKRKIALSPTAREYTWLGADHPPTLPLDLLTVALTIENTHHYALNSSTSAASFLSLYPRGSHGFVRLGPHDRFFGLSMYHQLHCLDSLRRAILGLAPHGEQRLGMAGMAGWQEDHVGHCLNYLRQTILCAADVTLEPEVVEGAMDAEEGLGVTHVCRDWGAVREYAEKNYEEWKQRVAKGEKGGT